MVSELVLGVLVGAGALAGGYGVLRGVYDRGRLEVLSDDGIVKIDEVENHAKANNSLTALRNAVDEADDEGGQ